MKIALRCFAGTVNAASCSRPATPPASATSSRAATPTRPSAAEGGGDAVSGVPLTAARVVLLRLHAVPATDDTSSKSDEACVHDAAVAACGFLNNLTHKSYSVVCSLAPELPLQGHASTDVLCRLGVAAARAIGLIAERAPGSVCQRLGAAGCHLDAMRCTAFMSTLLDARTSASLRFDTLDLRANVMQVGDLSKLMRWILNRYATPSQRHTAPPFRELLLRDNPGAENPAGSRVCQLLAEEFEGALRIDVAIDAEDFLLPSIQSSAASSPPSPHRPSPTRPERAVVTTPSTPSSTDVVPTTDRARVPLDTSHPADVSVVENVVHLSPATAAALERQHIALTEQWHRCFFVELSRVKALGSSLEAWVAQVVGTSASHTACQRRVLAAAAKPGSSSAVFGTAVDSAEAKLIVHLESSLLQERPNAASAVDVIKKYTEGFVKRDVAPSIRRCDFLLAVHDYFTVSGSLLESPEVLRAKGAGRDTERRAQRAEQNANAAIAAALPPSGTPRKELLRYNTSTADGLQAATSESLLKEAASITRSVGTREAKELTALWHGLERCFAESIQTPTPPGGMPLLGLTLRCELLKALVAFRGVCTKYEDAMADAIRVVTKYAMEFSATEMRMERLQEVRKLQQQQLLIAKRNAAAAAASTTVVDSEASCDEDAPVPRNAARLPVAEVKPTSMARSPKSPVAPRKVAPQPTAARPTSPASPRKPPAAVAPAVVASVVPTASALEAAHTAARRAKERRQREQQLEEQRKAEEKAASQLARQHSKPGTPRQTVSRAPPAVADAHHSLVAAPAASSSFSARTPSPKKRVVVDATAAVETPKSKGPSLQRLPSVSISPFSSRAGSPDQWPPAAVTTPPPQPTSRHTTPLVPAAVVPSADTRQQLASKHATQERPQQEVPFQKPEPSMPNTVVPSTKACRRRDDHAPQALTQPVRAATDAALPRPISAPLAEPQRSHANAVPRPTAATATAVDTASNENAVVAKPTASATQRPPTSPGQRVWGGPLSVLAQRCNLEASPTAVPRRSDPSSGTSSHKGDVLFARTQAEVTRSRSGSPVEKQPPPPPPRSTSSTSTAMSTASLPSTTDEILERLRRRDPQLHAEVSAHLRSKEAHIAERVHERMKRLMATIRSSSSSTGTSTHPSRSTSSAAELPLEWC